MKLLVLDGNSILNRAYYGVKGLSTKDGFFTNAIYGFLTTFEKLKEETTPDAIAIAFDVKKPTFRHEAFDGYKAKRKGMPEDLASQLPVLKELLVFLGYKIVECEGFEADDILGTLAYACQNSDNDCVIATGDRDSLQLVSDKVSVRIAATKFGKPEVTLFDEDKIFEKYGVTPKQLIDIKAIQGDSSDNIPGVPGIGEKGASELITKFKSINYIYENIDTIDIKDGMRKKLINGKDSAFMSYMLGTIRTDVPIETNIASFIPSAGDKAAAVRLMRKLEFFKLIEKMGLDDEVEATPAEKQETNYIINDANIDLTKLYDKLKPNKEVQFLYTVSKKAPNVLTSINVIVDNSVYCISNESTGFAEFAKNLFEDASIQKQTYDIKTLAKILESMEISEQNLTFDIMLAAYLLNPSSSDYDIKRLCDEYGISYSQITSDEGDVVNNLIMIPKLIKKLKEEIKGNDQEYLLNDIEIPLAKVLARMEIRGFGVDSDGIKAYGDTLASKIQALQDKIYEHLGKEININSSKQLGVVLFEDLGLPTGKKTKSGYSTSAEVLEGIKYMHPVVELILEYRTLSKLKSTYCDGMLKEVTKDNRIHTEFNQVETRTGRISSTKPNLQNIPVRTEIGRELRKFFKAKDGYVLVDADYSQIELRVLSHVANDKIMIDAFKNNDDIHTITASQVFHVPEDMITPLIRSRAKAVNFGIVYGIGAFSLSKDIGVSVKEAKEYINHYLDNYSGVKKYMEDVCNEAREMGYVKTMFNRRRYLPELNSSNFNLRAFGERVAKNMPIQGAAADIIKIAMIRVENRLKKENLKSKLILQIHDELIVEAPLKEASEVADLLREEMEAAANLLVPLIAEACVGETWYDAKS